MSDAPIDVLAIASQELIDNTIPEPAMMLENLTIFGAVYYLQQAADYVVRHITGQLLEDPQPDADDNADVIKALEAVVLANGNLNGACVLLGIFDE